MMKKIEGKVVAKKGMMVAVIGARFNEIIVNKLVGGAVDGLVRHGVEEDNITIAWVPGAFESPLAAQKMAASGKWIFMWKTGNLYPVRRKFLIKKKLTLPD